MKALNILRFIACMSLTVLASANEGEAGHKMSFIY